MGKYEGNLLSMQVFIYFSWLLIIKQCGFNMIIGDFNLIQRGTMVIYVMKIWMDMMGLELNRLISTQGYVGLFWGCHWIYTCAGVYPIIKIYNGKGMLFVIIFAAVLQHLPYYLHMGCETWGSSTSQPVAKVHLSMLQK